MSRAQRILFRIGGIGAIVTGGLHLIAHFQGAPPAANETERTLWSLLTTYRFSVAGSQRTMWEFYTGFSLAFSTFSAFVGVLDLAVLRMRRDDAALLRVVAGLNAGAFGILLAISVVHFILPPTICFAVVSLAFAASLLGRR